MTPWPLPLMARTVLRRLELANGRRIVAGRTLLFLDEVQACPRAIMALRYFYEQVPELHVIAAGSLLEFVMGDIPVPIGRVQHLYLYPMTFREYLLGMGNEVAADWVLQHPSTVDESLQLLGPRRTRQQRSPAPAAACAACT